MKHPLLPVLAVAVGGLALAACSSGASTSPSASMPMGGQASSMFAASSDCQAYVKANPAAKVTTTKDYVMVAGVGPSEAMYTRAQATAQKPTSGELMISGMMDATNSMAMGTGTAMRHVEVHICSKATGKALTGAMPLMTLSQGGNSSTITNMSVAEMTGLDGIAADTHYGNNVSMMDGSNYSLRVTLNGQTGTFTMTAPAMGQ
jgi:hypothetical protein